MDDLEQTKICTKCLLEKPLSMFQRQKALKDGYNYRCKLCASELAKIWRKSNLVVYAAQAKKWRLENTDRVRELNRLANQRWRKQSPAKAQEAKDRYRNRIKMYELFLELSKT